MADTPHLPRYRTLTLLASFVLVAAAMSWARAVLIPVALAILLSFLLSPPVRFLQTRGLARIPAVIAVVVAAFVLLGGILWVISAQLSQLADNVKDYEKHANTKLDRLRESI